MEVIEVKQMPCGTKVQLEEWSKSYPSLKAVHMIACYPISRVHSEKQFGPFKNQTFRLSLQFERQSEARQALNDLAEGKTDIKDYKSNAWDKELFNYL